MNRRFHANSSEPSTKSGLPSYIETLLCDTFRIEQTRRDLFSVFLYHHRIADAYWNEIEKSQNAFRAHNLAEQHVQTIVGQFRNWGIISNGGAA